MVTCYAPDGTAHQKYPVDARECCDHCGYSMIPPDTGEISGNGSGEKLPEVDASAVQTHKPKGAK